MIERLVICPKCKRSRPEKDWSNCKALCPLRISPFYNKKIEDKYFNYDHKKQDEQHES